MPNDVPNSTIEPAFEARVETAVRVLSREGAQRFTTARVAEAAGVSVGSLYQYFPNKEAILFRLQTDEWKRTGELMHSILADTSRAPLDRLRATVTAFFLSEWDEASLRIALGDSAPSYREAPEVQDHRNDGLRRSLRLLGEVLPNASTKERRFTADVVMTTLRGWEEGLRAIAYQDRSGSLVGCHGRDVVCVSISPDRRSCSFIIAFCVAAVAER